MRRVWRIGCRTRASALPATKADAPGLKKAMGKLQAALLKADDELNAVASEESVSVRAQVLRTQEGEPTDGPMGPNMARTADVPQGLRMISCAGSV